MQSVAYHLQKGGVGKTTLSGTTAGLLAGPTVLVDCDPQGNASAWFTGEAEPRYEIADVLMGEVTAAEAIVSRPYFDLMVTFGLNGRLKQYAENALSNEPFVFVDLVAELARLGYKHAVFDLSPGMGRLERSVLLAVDEVVTPLTPEHFSLDGIEIFRAELERLSHQLRRAPAWKRLVVNEMNRTIDQHKRILSAAEQADKLVYVVPQDAAFRKAQAAGVRVQDLEGPDRPRETTLTALSGLVEALWH